MEDYEPRKRRKYYQQKYVEHPAVYFASILMLVYQIARLIRIFTDAAAAKADNLATPESYSLGGILGAALMIVLAFLIFWMLLRQRNGTTRLRSGRRYLLIDALLLIYGVIRAINRLIAIIDFFMVLYLLDFLAAAAALCVPAVTLWWADLERIPPEDLLLLLCGSGAAGFSLLAVIILAISIGKDYTVIQVLPELALRVAMLLCGAAEIIAALRLRAEAPIAEPVEKAKPERAAEPDKPKKPKKELHIKLFDNLPGYDDEEPELDDADDLFGEDEELSDLSGADDDVPEDDPDEAEETAYAPRAAQQYAPYAKNGYAQTERGGHAQTEYGEYTPEAAGAVRESRQTSAPRRPGSAMEEAGVRPARMPEGVKQQTRVTCPDCGRRFPAVLGTCPYCGRFLGDE